MGKDAKHLMSREVGDGQSITRTGSPGCISRFAVNTFPQDKKINVHKPYR